MSHRTKERRKARTLTAIDERYATDHHRPREEEDEGLRHQRIREDGAKILKYDVTMKRNNVLCVASV
jgi:hypothetical protein